MDNLKIAVILGSTRPERFSEQPGTWIADKLKKIDGLDVETLDLRDYPMPFFDEAKSPTMAPEGFGKEVVEKWRAKIAEADAFVVVTPEYNHGYSAVLKNAMDYVYFEWNKKPISFVAYGGVGGARAVEQLRLVAVELQMAPIRHAVHINNFWGLLDESGKLKTETLEAGADAMIENLVWWAKALKVARA